MNRIDQAISKLAERRASGHALFAASAETLEIGLGCRWVGIVGRTSDPNIVQFLARRSDGADDTLGTYDLTGTPCVEIYAGKWRDNYCHIEAGVSRIYPDSPFAALHAETYRAEAFYDNDGEIAGHVFVMDDKPQTDNPQSRAFFRLIVQRVGAGYNRWRMQDELDERERRFRDYAETNSDWLWELDDQHRYIYVSEKSEQIRGHHASYFLGRTPFETVPEENSPAFRKLKEKMDRHESFRNFITRRIRDGKPVYVSTSGKPIFDKDGTFRGYRGTSRDTTAEMLAREQLRDAINNISEAFALWDNEDRLVVWNDKFVGISTIIEDLIKPGVTFEELVRALVTRGQYLDAGVSEEDYIAERVKLHREKHEPIVRQIYDGRWLMINEQPTDYGGIVGIWTDITDLKKREIEIEKSEARFRDFAESSSDWFWEIDTEFRLVYRTSGLSGDTGDTVELGRPRWESDDIVPGTEDMWARHRADLEAHRPFRDFRFSAFDKDGAIRHFKTSGVPIFSDDGTFLGYRGTTSDVTEQVALEEQLAQSQKMEAVGQLTGGVAHDFNNLLAIIVGNLEMIRDDLPDDSPLHKYLVPAMRSASRGGELTHRLLAFSRRQTLEPEHTDTNTLIDGIADIIRRTLGPSIDVEIDLADQLWPAFIDAHQLENAIVNLAINARDAMPEGGKLTIETANIVLDDAYAATQQDVIAGDYVLVAVSDTGHGMPAEVIARAFDPFFTTKDVGRGTGLGLSMVYGFVKQSHGHVRIYSEVGEGTSIKLYLPRSGADEADTAVLDPGLAESSESEAATLLIVEDDPDVRDLAVTQLTSLGYRVLDAGNGHEALRLFDETPTIDLVVTDLALPGGMNGHDIAVALRERNADMRVLLMSGYTEGAMSHQDRIPTGLKILHKPFTRAQLADAIKETLRT